MTSNNHEQQTQTNEAMESHHTTAADHTTVSLDEEQSENTPSVNETEEKETEPFQIDSDTAVGDAVYDENQIQVLEGLEAVRKRPGMYIGTTSEMGLHHLVYEIVDNSIDEAMAGACDTIVVQILQDGSIEIQDNGRGVPGAIHHKMGIPTLEVVFTILHAGGKFGGEGYKISGGLHGVGASVVNALSEWMEVRNCNDGMAYTERFVRGKVDRAFACEGSCGDEHGLYVRFMPDADIFETVKFNYDTILKRLREQAFLNAGVRIILRDLRGDEEDHRENELYYEGGLRSFVEFLNASKETIHPDVIYVKGRKGDLTAEVAIQYNTDLHQNIQSFANNMNTVDGGTHVEGFKNALRTAMNNYAKKLGILKNDESLKGEDTLEGICAVISVKLPDAQFESQTKAKLGNSEVRTFVYGIVKEKLEEYMEENPQITRTILEKALLASRAREAAQKAREQTRKSVLDKGSSLPGKLRDCHEKNRDLTELFLVEGDSAGGSATDGRDSRYQAILPLRGKVLNVEKVRLDKVYGNLSLIPIIQALGCGIGEEFDIDKLRYGKIIIMADADVDGSHIRILLLTFFFRHMPQLIEQGHIYLAQPPLYKVFRGNKEYYAFSDEERDVYLEELGEKAQAERYKGLGEMDPAQLWETTMDPETRTILRVNIDDAQMCDEIFSKLMGDRVEPRRKFIEENARYAENLDI